MTKLRVVFEASAKTTSGVSLKGCRMVRTELEEDILTYWFASASSELE